MATNSKKHQFSQHFCTDFFASLQKIRKVGVEVGVEVGVGKCLGEGRIERLWDTLLKRPSLLRVPNAAEKYGYTLTDHEVLSILADAFIK